MRSPAALDQPCIIDCNSRPDLLATVLTILAVPASAVHARGTFCTLASPAIAGNHGLLPHISVHLRLDDVMRTENVRCAEDWDVVLSGQPPPICVPPPATPMWYTPAAQPIGALLQWRLPRHGGDLFYDPGDFARMQRWRTVMNAGWRLAEEHLLLPCKDHPHWGKRASSIDHFKFPYEDLPGGADGLVIFANRIRHQFRSITWDMRPHFDSGGTLPLFPQDQQIDPKQRSDINLLACRAEAVRRRYSDTGFITEMATVGIDNRGKPWVDVILCPPYKGLFDVDKFRFFAEHNMAKRQRKPPRYLGTYDYFPLIPLYICPRNVAARASDGKLRITADFGGPRNLDAQGREFAERQPASRPGPLSLNANLHQHHGAFPPLVYLDVASLMQGAAVLGSIRACFPHEALPNCLRVCKSKSDFTAFYETLGRHARCDSQQVQSCFSGGLEVDPRLIFGGTDCPHECNRFMFFLTDMLYHRLRDCQHNTQPPPEATKWLKAFSEHGHDAHFTLGGFFDDSGYFYFEYLREPLIACCRQFWRDYGLEVCDGSDGRKSKEEHHQADSDMEFLGLHVSTDSHFEINVGPAKCLAYSTLANEISADAAKSSRREVHLEKCVRLEGQLNFCATTACPSIKGDLSVLRSVVNSASTLYKATQAAAATGRRPAKLRVRVSTDAAHRMALLTQRLATSGGAACAPRHGVLGKAGTITLRLLVRRVL